MFQLSAMLVAVSDIAIDCRTAAVTVNEKVFDVTPLIVAVMFDVPVPAPMARPLGADRRDCR